MTNPTILSAALFVRDERALTAHRKSGCPPFAGQWLLPMTPVHPVETAEDAVKRYTREQFGVDVTRESFVETVYMEDPDDRTQYVTNIFRAEMSGGPVRFRADGDYDDARWLASADLAQLWMPPALRDPLVRILSDPEYAPASTIEDASLQDESSPSNAPALAAEALPLGERAPETGEDTPPPDNRAAWDAIASTYQHEFYRDRGTGRLLWTRGIYEDELRLLDDVRGKHALVIGCGGGQDCVELVRMGAVAVGIDPSGEQIAYAKKYAAKHDASNASFAEGSAEDLGRFDDASFDLAVSIHALGYVEHADAAIHEAARVLRPGGVLALAVPHPWNQIFSDAAPFRIERSYYTAQTPYIDWNWDEERFGASGRLRDWRRTLGEWFDLVRNAGFAVERLIEPYQGDITGPDAQGYDMQRAKLTPQVLIIKARKC